MRILFTNNTLTSRAGTELYVRDVAIALQKRGHTPFAYSSHLGEVAEELRAAAIPVVSDLADLPFQPDIIHGHHHLDTMAALLSLPDVPAISYCHGWRPWQEMVPRFPRILRYIAVDHACFDRIVIEQKIPEEKVEMLLNFIDLSRFSKRSSLPEKPRRALIFHNYKFAPESLDQIRRACAAYQISLDCIGRSFGKTTEEPWNLLPDYDIVFAIGRSALEAMAAGCAVILLSSKKFGKMVTSQDFDYLRNLNFGLRILRNPLDAEIISAQLAKYDARDAMAVSERIRREADLEKTVDRLEQIYAEIIAEYRQQPSQNRAAELQAAGAYLQTFSAFAKDAISPQPKAQKPHYKNKLKRRIGRISEKLQRWAQK